VALLIAVIGAVYAATLRPGQDWGGDFSQYVNHARNLALGHAYGETRYEVTLPEAATYMPASYPPVFPLLLAPVYRQFGLNFVAMKVVVQTLFVLAAVAYYALSRSRGLEVTEAAIGAAAFALSGIVLSLKDLVLADSTYLFFAGLTLSTLVFIERQGWDKTRPIPAAAAVAILLVLSYASRGIGLALIVAFALHEAVMTRRVRLFGALVLALVAAGVIALSATLYDGRVYRTQFAVMPSVYLENALFYLGSPASLWSGSPAALRRFLFVLSSVPAVVGWARAVACRPTIVEFYVVTMAAIVVLYSTDHNQRYVLPLVPLYLLYFFEGLSWLRRRLMLGSWVTAGAYALLILGTGFNVRGMEKGPYRQGVEQPTFLEASDFIRRNVDRDALVVSWNPRVLALYTDRRSVWYPETADDMGFERYLETIRAQYVLVYLMGERDKRWLAPHVTRQRSRFAEIFRNSDFALYRYHSETANQ